MDNFCATQTAMRFTMMAYNLMSLFRQLTHQKQAQPKLSILMFNCFTRITNACSMLCSFIFEEGILLKNSW
jgi:hypothetical protein